MINAGILFWSIRASFQRHGTPVSGDANDRRYQLTEELAIKDSEGLTLADKEKLAYDDNEDFTLDDNEESVINENEELFVKDVEGPTTNDIERFVIRDGVQRTTKELAVNQVGLSPGNKTTLTPHIPRENPVDSNPDLLHKKDFQKLPQWDFEDVYTRNDQPRQIVSRAILSCVK